MVFKTTFAVWRFLSLFEIGACGIRQTPFLVKEDARNSNILVIKIGLS